MALLLYLLSLPSMEYSQVSTKSLICSAFPCLRLSQFLSGCPAAISLPLWLWFLQTHGTLCPQKNLICEGFTCSSRRTPERATWHRSFPLHMVMYCLSHCEWKGKDRIACSYCLFWFWSAFKVHVDLHKFGDCLERWWSSSGLCVAGRVVTLWNAHPGVSLFQTVCLRYNCTSFFMCKKERTVA